jgi:hypothetical protein
VRRAAAVLLFLMLAGDWTALYASEIWSPLKWLSSVMYAPLPIKIRIVDMMLIAVLVMSMSKKDAKGPRVQPMRGAMFLAVGAVMTMFVYGIARGGDVRAASWQIYLLMSCILAGFTFASVCKTSQHYLVLGKAIIAAGIYRATMELVFYIGWVRNSGTATPAHLTTHDDTVLWIVCITYLLINLVESRNRKAMLWAAGLVPFFLVAVQLNNRRLAWVSLVFSLIVFYVAQRPSKAKRRILQLAMAMVPIIGLYVLVGWGRPERIFKPLKSLETVSTKEDDSTKARNVENLGLIATSNAYGLITGPGWGHKYIELSNKYSIAANFELWQYIPHNSILGIFAFTGYLGFIGFWMMFPTAMFLHARSARHAKESLDRAVGIAGMTQMTICLNQMFGDMGTFSPTTMYVLAVSFAAAMRVPVEAGVWLKPKVSTAPALEPPKPDAPPATEAVAKIGDAAWRS